MKDFIEDVAKTVKVPADIAKAAVEPAAREIGEGIGNLFNLIFAPLEKAKLEKDHKIKLFKMELESGLKEIPSDNLVSGPLNIVGPALEAAKFYIDDEEIRHMFTKLITSSMDIEHRNAAHPSFVEIIKQMSSFDAQILMYLRNNYGSIGSANILNSKVGELGLATLVRNFFPFEGINIDNFSRYVSSVDNLVRLGILYIDENLNFTDEERYKVLYEHPLYHEIVKELEDSNVELTRTYWNFTDLGKDFCKCCLDTRQ